VAGEALRELGVWEAFQRLEQSPSAIHRAAWGGRLEERSTVLPRYGPDLHLDRARFDALLADAAVARGAVLFRPARVQSCSIDRGARLIVQGEGALKELAVRRVADATGRGAAVARKLGARRFDADRLIGVARSYLRGTRDPFTLVEAAEEGWWYTGPQPGGRLIALFVTDGDSPAHQARHGQVWARCLDTAPLTRERLRGAEALGPPRGYLAAPGILDWDPHQPVLPVGDAALSFDPIAADGLCFALRSGLEAAAALLGTRGSPLSYRDGIHGIFRQHLERRERIYKSERHRPTTFWQRSRGQSGCSTKPTSPP
jgi:flavin-dependent dehydrogenase